MPSDTQTAPVTAGAALEAFAEALGETRLDAEWAMADLLGCSRLELPRHASRELSAVEQERLAGLRTRLLSGEPLQYVLGHTDFMGLRLRCDRRALIPRPETEGLVEMALADAGEGPVRAADVGTGTGCVAVALAVRLPGARVQALDISRQALALAAENVAAHGVEDRVTLRESDLLSEARDGTLDLVVSNPPYVTLAEWAELPGHIRLHEPASALAAGEDGLAVIRRLAPQAFRALRPGGQLLLEIGETQGAVVAALLAAAGFVEVVVRRDLAGHDRYVKGDTPCSSR